MSAPQPAGKRHPWEVALALADEAEAERVAALSDAELDAELRACGMDPDAILSPVGTLPPAGRAEEAASLAVARWPAAEALPPRAEAPASPADAPVVALDANARRRRMVWLAAASIPLFVGAAVLLARQLGGPAPAATIPVIGPDDLRQEQRAADARRSEQARHLRDRAEVQCMQQPYRLGLCARALDDAKSLDPAGEDEPRVEEMRKKLYLSQHPSPEMLDPKWPSMVDGGW